ncbi:MAG: PTS fructose transporter subunit IIA [Gammaproteobacteria bacterium]|nr:PTS fructose transporter subunit IIA [Gammaproteobacteria bacterium]
MTVAVLVICHDRIAQVMVEVACGVLEVMPMAVDVLSVFNGDDRDAVLQQARQRVSALDQGDGVLVLTDMYGSTPANIAMALSDSEQVRVVTGINLPMLIRVLNYPRLTLAELVVKAVSGGRDGVFSCAER